MEGLQWIHDTWQLWITLATMIGVGWTIHWRVGRIERTLDGDNGIVRRVETLEIRTTSLERVCEERHLSVRASALPR